MNFVQLSQTKCQLEQEAARGIEGAAAELEKVNAKIEEMRNAANTVTIEVFHEAGYKWSVHIEGEEESRETNINKAEAMQIARALKKTFKNAIINEQKLNRKEKAENIKTLHQTSETYHDFYKYN
jgi:hypothetical protein